MVLAVDVLWVVDLDGADLDLVCLGGDCGCRCERMQLIIYRDQFSLDLIIIIYAYFVVLSSYFGEEELSAMTLKDIISLKQDIISIRLSNSL